MWGGFLRQSFILIIIFFFKDLQCQQGVVDFSVQALLGRDINTVSAERVLSRCEFYPHLKKILPELLKARLYDGPVVIDGMMIDSRAEESFSLSCFNCLKPDLVPDSAKLDVSAFILEFLKNELLDRLYAHAKILRVAKQYCNANVHNDGLMAIERLSAARKKLALLGERNDYFIELIGLLEASIQVLSKVTSMDVNANTKKQTLDNFMNLFRVCNFFYKIHVMEEKDSVGVGNKVLVDKKKLVKKIGANSCFDSGFLSEIKNGLALLIAVRIKNMAGFVLDNSDSNRYNQSCFAKICKEIIEERRGSSTDQLELMDFLFRLLVDTFVERLHKFTQHVVIIGEMLQKQNEMDYKTKHAWPCGCTEAGCKAGQRDFDEYSALLNIINCTLIDMIKIFDGANSFMIDKEFYMYSESTEYCSLLSSMQDCTRDRLERFIRATRVYQM